MNSIAVIGAGTSGYLTVYYLCQNFPEVKINWYRPAVNKPIGVGEASVPKVQNFLANLGISSKHIIQKCNGSLKLGLKFDGFFRKGESFFHPFGNNEDEQSTILEIWKQNKIPEDILSYADIATHFDTGALSEYIEDKISRYSSVTVINTIVESIDSIDSDLIVDCTGFNRSIMKQLLPGNFKSIDESIPNNTALVYRCSYTDKQAQRLPYTTCRAMTSGWSWTIPLNNKLSFGYVHCKEDNVLSEFVDFITSMVGNVDVDKIKSIDMTTGRIKRHIITRNKKTVAAIGLSSCFIEPLESTGLYLIVTGIEQLGQYIRNNITQKQFSNHMNNEFDTIVNFILAHYKYTSNKNDYWQQYTGKKVELFKKNNLFPRSSWEYILDGMKQFRKETKRPTVKKMLYLLKQSSYNIWLDNEKYSR